MNIKIANRKQTSLKHTLIGGYLIIALLSGTLFWLFGEYSYKNYAYNLGRGFMWPFNMFQSFPELDAESPVSYARSYMEVLQSHPNDREGHQLFNEALGYLAFYMHAQQNDAVTMENFDSLIAQGKLSANLFKEMLEKDKIANDIRDYTDGMTFGDLASDRDDIREDLIDLLKDRS